jgi:hypothetical protein
MNVDPRQRLRRSISPRMIGDAPVSWTGRWRWTTRECRHLRRAGTDVANSFRTNEFWRCNLSHHCYYTTEGRCDHCV